MRTLLMTTGLTLLAAAACSSEPGDLKAAPVLKVTSPARSLLQNKAGAITVKGTVAPSDESGSPIKKVMVNNVQANVAADGSFQAVIDVKPGATLIHTSAIADDGGQAEDTRAVEAGELRPVGANVENAITAAMSKTAFAKLAGAAGPMIKGLDMGAMLAPMQPMVHMGDESGEDCLFARVYVDDVNMSDVKINLTPVDGGLQFRAEIDGLDVPSHARYAAACVDGSNTIRVTADKVVVAGTLVVTPDGKQGFKTTLNNQTVSLTNMHVAASGIPGTIMDLIHMDTAIQFIVSKGAEMAMEPMMNKALGGLAGPQTLDVMGKQLTVQVDPTAISFDPDGAFIALDTKMLIAGTESSPGFIYTDNGIPSMDPGNGMQLGLADDLANEMMAELMATGMLNLAMPASGGTFDNSAIQMTLPPMISADPADGKMKVILGDMIATYTSGGQPVAKAAINASIDLKIVPAANGYGVAMELGTPTVHATVLDDIANISHFTDADLAHATEACLNAQISSISKLLTNIPLPALAGVQMRNLSVGADDGYVMMKGDIE